MALERNWNVVTLSFLVQVGFAVLFAASFTIIGWGDFSSYVGGTMTVKDGLEWFLIVLLTFTWSAFPWMLLASLPLYCAWLYFGRRSRPTGLAALAVGAVLTAVVLLVLYVLRLRPSDMGADWWGVVLAVVGCLVAYAPLWFARRDVSVRRPPVKSWLMYLAEMAAILAFVLFVLAQVYPLAMIL
jgi:hypothetical protein